MVESEEIQAIVIHTAVWAVSTVVMALWDVDVGPQPATSGQRHDRPVLEKLSVNWNIQERHIELLNFEMVVTSILETEAYGANQRV